MCGLGTGLLLLGAMLRPRYEAIMKYFNTEGLFEDFDLIFTAEGGIEYQTPRGKIPAEVAIRAKKNHIPVIVLARTIGDEAEVNYDVGINAYASILQRPSTPLAEAIAESEWFLTESAEGVMRMVVVGRKLAKWWELEGMGRTIYDLFYPGPELGLLFHGILKLELHHGVIFVLIIKVLHLSTMSNQWYSVLFSNRRLRLQW